MAVLPLFFTNSAGELSTEALYDSIRMEYDKATDSSIRSIERGMRRTRAILFRRLGSDKVTSLLAITPVENATTQDELDRSNAEILESLLVEYYIVCHFPVAVYDAIVSDGPIQIWNKEPLVRDIDPDTLNERKAALMGEIEELFHDLISEDTGSSNVRVFTSEEDGFYPGTTMTPDATPLRDCLDLRDYYASN